MDWLRVSRCAPVQEKGLHDFGFQQPYLEIMAGLWAIVHCLAVAPGAAVPSLYSAIDLISSSVPHLHISFPRDTQTCRFN